MTGQLLYILEITAQQSDFKETPDGGSIAHTFMIKPYLPEEFITPKKTCSQQNIELSVNFNAIGR